MLATSDAPPPKNPVIEPKRDGIRSIITLRSDGIVSIRSRNGKDLTNAYSELHRRPSSMVGREGVFDGEIIAVDDTGRYSFQRVQRRMNVLHPSKASIAATPVFFVVFDVFWLGATLMTSVSLAERQAILEGLIAPRSAWQITNRFDGP
jgi:bifunctional non-homologous end joining protein LigD